MKRSTIVKGSMAALLAVLLTIPAFAWKLGNKEMVQNGGGTRTKLGMSLYYATLFVPQELKGATEAQILDADQPMSITINITSGMITKDKFVTAVSEGFDKAAGAGYGTPDKQAYINLYNNVTITKGDTFSNHYDGKNITVIQSTGGKSVTLGVVKGLQFKKAFFAIFIGPKPVQDSLKKGMLGR